MFKMYRIPKGDNAMTYKQCTPEELAKEADKRNGTNQPIKVGDHVRSKSDKEYLGKTVSERVLRIVTIVDGEGSIHELPDSILEVAPRLTENEAWNELPFTILGQLNKYLSTWGTPTLWEDGQRAIRHEAYKLLGGAGIKVTDEVKERVRKAIRRIADAMGVELS